jgi:hypothetical protein
MNKIQINNCNSTLIKLWATVQGDINNYPTERQALNVGCYTKRPHYAKGDYDIYTFFHCDTNFCTTPKNVINLFVDTIQQNTL